MANILDKALQVLDGGTKSAGDDKPGLVSSITGGVTSLTTGVTQSVERLENKLSTTLDETAATAKTYVALTTVLQAVAAFAALGIFIVQVKQYGDIKRRKTGNNPRRKRRR